MTPSTQDARATGLVELAVRCEQATGADFNLDIDIGIALDRAPDAFTASLDAAMSLVPADMAFLLDWLRYDGKGDRPVYWEAFVQFIDDAVNRGNSEAATPALALTAAALRARALAASTKDQPHDA